MKEEKNQKFGKLINLKLSNSCRSVRSLIIESEVDTVEGIAIDCT